MKVRTSKVLERCIEEAVHFYFENRVNKHFQRVEFVQEDLTDGSIRPLGLLARKQMQRDIEEELSAFIMNEIHGWFEVGSDEE